MEKKLTLFLMLLLSLQGMSQVAIVSGHVLDSLKQPIAGALVYAIGTTNGVHSDSLGNYQLTLPFGDFVIVAKAVSYESQRMHLRVYEPGQNLDFQLTESLLDQPEIVVNGLSETARLKDQAQTIGILDASSYYHQSSNTGDLVSRMAGVRVRQEGGLGGQAQFSINGMSSKQIRFFVDGVPLEFYGAGLGIQVLPIQMLERIEIHKGTIPIHLGADALGGAIQAITRKEKQNYLDLGYSYGSFNTHKTSISGKYILGKKGWHVNFSSFYNYSDNNYKVDVEIPDAFGSPQKAVVKRFHDRYSNYLIKGEIGWLGKNSKDGAVLHVLSTSLNDEIQHNALMTQPYGKARYQESMFGLGIRGRKEHLFLKNLAAEGFAGINKTRSLLVDTSLNAYTWDGKIYNRRQYGGEINSSRNLLTFLTDQVLGKATLTYAPAKKHRITLSYLIQSYFRKGNDPVADSYYGQDIFRFPNSLLKQAGGMSYQLSLFKSRIISVSSWKYFGFKSNGYSIVNTKELLSTSSFVRQMGASQALKWQIGLKLMARISYEYATRLPDELELFGNYYLVKPNPLLVPETSHNVNAGLVYESLKVRTELTAFHRNTDNIIYLRSSQFFAQYQNLLKADIKGLEAEITYKPFSGFQVSSNATYQDLRNRTLGDQSGSISDRYVNARLPNIPYLFGNAEMKWSSPSLFKRSHRVQWWWNTQYIHAFFLYWAVDGRKESKATIPAQWIQNTGIAYSISENHLTISFEIMNLLDAKAYDNFNVQKPGIQFVARLRMYLNKAKS